MVITVLALIVWQAFKFYWWIIAWLVWIWMRVVWKTHWCYVKGMSYVLDRTSSSQSPQSPNGNKRKAIEMEEQSSERSNEPLAIEDGRHRDTTVQSGYAPTNSFKLAAFSACFEAVDNLRRRDALRGVHDEELIQMLSAIIRGGRELYSMRIPWPLSEGRLREEGSNGVGRINGSIRPTSPPESTDWEAIYSKYRSKYSGEEAGDGEGTSEAAKTRAKSPEYVDNLNKIHTSLASLHAIVEKTNAEKEELKKLQIQSSSSDSSLPAKEIKEEERSPPAVKKEEKSSREKKEEKERRDDSGSNKSRIDYLFDDGSDEDEERGPSPPVAKKRKEESRDEKRRRKEEEKKKKRGGEDEFLDSDEDDVEKKEREKEKRREEREREKREAIMAISGCYTVRNNEQEERDREREREREKVRREEREEEERDRLKEKAIEKEKRREKEEEMRKKEEEEKRRKEREEEEKKRREREEEEKKRREREEEEKKRREREEERATASPVVMPARKLNKKCTCSLPFPDLSEFNDKLGNTFRTLEESGTNWSDIKNARFSQVTLPYWCFLGLHSIVATLRNGRWVRARVNETRADGLYLGLESSGGGFSGRVKECTGCAHINKIVAIEKK